MNMSMSHPLPVNTVIPDDEMIDGFSAEEIFEGADGLASAPSLTFDDLIALPGAIDFGVHEVELDTRVSRNYSLRSPLCSSPMDTVTEHEMAIGMALHGGIGFIHANLSVDDQVGQVFKVKNYENGFIVDPVLLSPNHTVEDLDKIRLQRKISGVPVTEDGKIGSRLVGLVSNRDIDFFEDRTQRLEDVMTPLNKLIVGRYPITIEEANKILKESKKGYLPIVDSDGKLRALTTRTDLKKNREFPLASRDSKGRLLVGAAVKASSRDTVDMKRIKALYEAGCNIIILDALNGDNDIQLTYLKEIKSQYPDLDVIAGNVARPSQVHRLIAAGADGIRVGAGVGSIATTQLVKAVGRGQLSAIYSCAKAAHSHNIPILADGGVKNTGCLMKALAIGASCVIMGSLLAGVDESPGDYFFQDGVRLKHYRGNSSRETNSLGESASFSVTSTDPAYRLAAGVSGAVVDKGPLSRYIPYLCQSLRHGMQDMGVRSIFSMTEQLYSGVLRFELRSASAQREGGVHDLHSYTQRLYA